MKYIEKYDYIFEELVNEIELAKEDEFRLKNKELIKSLQDTISENCKLKEKFNDMYNLAQKRYKMLRDIYNYVEDHLEQFGEDENGNFIHDIDNEFDIDVIINILEE